jgi:hypothetical protein
MPSSKENAEFWIEKGKFALPLFQILESREILIADAYPAYKTIIKYRDGDTTKVELDVRARIGDLLYTLRFLSTELEFYRYQPIVDDMIKTFQISFDKNAKE